MTCSKIVRYGSRSFLVCVASILGLVQTGFSQELPAPIDCQRPPASARLTSILPCLIGKSVSILDNQGARLGGRLNLSADGGCVDGSPCVLELRWFLRRKRQIASTEVRSVRYTPTASSKRKALGWIVGAGVACGVTAALLSQGSGEGMGSATFVIGPLVGIPLGGMVGEANSVTVQIDNSRP